MERTAIEALITALEDNYRQNTGRSLDYTYGYMDAVAVLREMLDGIRPDVRRKCGMVAQEVG